MIRKQKEVPVYGEYDVIVAGGGVAGVAAALAAAQKGAKTLLIETQYMLGGLATAGLITYYLPLCDGMGHQLSYGLKRMILKKEKREDILRSLMQIYLHCCWKKN